MCKIIYAFLYFLVIIFGFSYTSIASQILKADFIQTRTIKGLPKPLITKGESYLHSEKGVLWVIREPFSHTILLCDQGMFTLEEGTFNPVGQSMPLQQTNELSRLLSAFLLGEFELLDGFHQQTLFEKGDKWQKEFTPNDRALKNYLSTIRINGNASHINDVYILRSNGDSESIIFKNYTVLPDHLNPFANSPESTKAPRKET